MPNDAFAMPEALVTSRNLKCPSLWKRRSPSSAVMYTSSRPSLSKSPTETPIPYISTSSPLPAVTLVNVPFLLLRYRAWSERRPLGCQSLLLTSRMSGQPSPSASKNAQPEPTVSGRYFLPARPVLWTKVIPAAAVTSVNWMELDGAAETATPRQEEQQQQLGVVHTFECVGDSTNAPIVETH